MKNFAVALFSWLLFARCEQGSVFEAFEDGYSKLPGWVITDSHTNIIHRFFDSSPFSPSNRYLALNRLPSPYVKDTNQWNATAVVIDLTNGKYSSIENSFCWDSQVGVQAQWGANDSQLFYNVLEDTYAVGYNEGATVGYAEDLHVNSIHANTHGDGDDVSSSSRSSNKLKSDLAGVKRLYSNGNGDGNVFVQKQSQKRVTARGVLYDITTQQRRLLDCPIYHVRNDGMYAASPNLHKIRYTQKGYGIRSYGGSAANSNAPKDDGLYLTEVSTGRCKMLVSLHRLAAFAGFDVEHTPTYGFHTKWSSDGQMIMFVVRTLEKPAVSVAGSVALGGYAGAALVEKIGSWLGLGPQHVRVQHLFVVDINGDNLKHVISWASRPFRRYTCSNFKPEVQKQYDNSNRNTSNSNSSSSSSSSSISSSRGSMQFDGRDTSTCRQQQWQTIKLRDGNHPHWVPGTHKISMNLQREGPGDQQSDTERKKKQSERRQRAPFEHQRSLNPAVRSKWSIVTIDVDSLPHNYSFPLLISHQIEFRTASIRAEAGHSSRSRSTMEPPVSAVKETIEKGSGRTPTVQTDQTASSLPAGATLAKAETAVQGASNLVVEEVHSVGTGHPNFLPGGRFLVVDAYAKELALFESLGRGVLRDRYSAPLRLIDVKQDKETWLLQMQITRTAVDTDTGSREGQQLATADSADTADTLWQQMLSRLWQQVTSALHDASGTANTAEVVDEDAIVGVTGGGSNRSSRSKSSSGNSSSIHNRYERNGSNFAASLNRDKISHERAPQKSRVAYRVKNNGERAARFRKERRQHLRRAAVATPSSSSSAAASAVAAAAVLGGGEDASWRCDMHPAFSRDFQFIAINGRHAGRERQVIVLQLFSPNHSSSASVEGQLATTTSISRDSVDASSHQWRIEQQLLNYFVD